MTEDRINKLENRLIVFSQSEQYGENGLNTRKQTGLQGLWRSNKKYNIHITVPQREECGTKKKDSKK